MTALQFSPDGTRFAVTNATPHGTELWLGTTADGRATRVANLAVNDVFRGAVRWMPDGSHVVVRAVDRTGPPPAAGVASGPAVQETARQLIEVYALIIPFRSFLYHLSVGILRGAGDTRTALLLEVGGVWLLSVPLALLGTHVFGLSIVGVFAFVGLQDLIVALLAGLRLRFGSWIRPIASVSAPQANG